MSKIQVVAERGAELIADAIAPLGFVPAPDLGRAYFRYESVDTYLGQPGLRFTDRIDRTTMHPSRAWIVVVIPAIFNPEVEAARDRALSSELPSLPETVSVELRGLAERRLKFNDHREFATLEGAAAGAARIARTLEEHFGWWCAQFATAESTYEYLAQEDISGAPGNYMTALILALLNNDEQMIRKFARYGFFHDNGPRFPVERFNRYVDLYRRIGDSFGVELPIPTWEEVHPPGL